MANEKDSQVLKEETKKAGKFGLIGIINTLIDFLIFNLAFLVLPDVVISQGFLAATNIRPILANITSTSVAMTFSFIANKNFVFRNKGGSILKQVVLFVLVTGTGLYLIQNGIIFLLINTWTWPLDFGYQIVTLLGLDGVFSEEFVARNGAKAIATVASMIWNFLMYRKFVFGNAS